MQMYSTLLFCGPATFRRPAVEKHWSRL